MGRREHKAEILRNEAWELWLKSRLNVIYFKRVIDRNNNRATKISYCVFLAGAIGTAAAKYFGQPWILSGIPIVVGLIAQVVRVPFSDKANIKAEFAMSRWSDLRHDSERVWKSGEKLGWRSQDVESKLLQLREREKVFDSLETEKTDRAILNDSQRELWNELGQPYD